MVSDSKKIVFAAKSGSSDALYLVDVDTGEKEKIRFDLDGVFSAAWSPSGNQLAYVGYEKGASDIYIYDIESKQSVNLTSDVFSDSEPTWSPDGSLIAFVSDRDNNTNLKKTDADEMLSVDYDNKNIYIVNVKTLKVDQITNTNFDEDYPVFSNTQDYLFFTSDSSGTRIYLNMTLIKDPPS